MSLSPHDQAANLGSISGLLEAQSVGVAGGLIVALHAGREQPRPDSSDARRLALLETLAAGSEQGRLADLVRRNSFLFNGGDREVQDRRALKELRRLAD